jgi:hypothetical protein
MRRGDLDVLLVGRIQILDRLDAAREALRAEIAPVRKALEKDLAKNHAATRREAGMTDADLALIAKGRIPLGYQAPHLLPLDDGGTNATSNLVLIKNDPDHTLITQYQIKQNGTDVGRSDPAAGMADAGFAGDCMARDTGGWCLPHQALSGTASDVGYR